MLIKIPVCFKMVGSGSRGKETLGDIYESFNNIKILYHLSQLLNKNLKRK